MPLDEQSRRLTQFAIGNQQNEINRLFYGISIGLAAFSAFMSKIFRPLLLKKNAITYLDDVFMQSQTKDEMFTVLEQYHKILQKENLKAAPDKSHFFLTRVKFLGHNFERNTITRFEEIKNFLTEQNSNTIPDPNQPSSSEDSRITLPDTPTLTSQHNTQNIPSDYLGSAPTSEQIRENPFNPPPQHRRTTTILDNTTLLTKRTKLSK